MGRRTAKKRSVESLRALIESGRYVIRPLKIADAMLQDLAESCSFALRSRSHMVRTKTR
jgi:anti-sigma28 factor (negative regulator of flagellin synthesis)